MRHSVLAICLALIVQVGQSQLTFTPRIGFENAQTCVSINDGNFISPLSNQFTPQAGARFDYKFKKGGHGVFAGISTSNTAVAFSFTNPEQSLTNNFSSRSSTQVRLEGGYQFNTKPILFKSNSNKSKPAQQRKTGCSKGESNMKHGCGSYSRSSSHCGKSNTSSAKQKSSKQPMQMRLQPQLGMAYIPSVENDFDVKTEATQSVYTYYAGNWNTAVIGGMGFEFAKGKNKLFQVNVQYLKGIGNLGNTTLTTHDGSKSVETKFSSRASSWSLNFGVPISFAKKPSSNKKQTNCQQQRTHCEQKTQYRCRVKI
ncbi:MAG: hypothetical protein E6H07_12090 [Bacteroidetes bacterium]|nr:MAG: hypothetical protein E6H07_12090 [Bacteroidota bacterium]